MPLGFGASRARGERRCECWGVYLEIAQRYQSAYRAYRLKALCVKCL